jgi:hypothetical protein
MLADPSFAYQQIGDEFGLTWQRVAHIATELGLDGKQRRHDRAFRVRPHVIRQFKRYPQVIQAVMDKLRRAGLQVAPRQVCKWLNERRDIETSSRLIPLVDDLTHILIEAGKNKLH